MKYTADELRVAWLSSALALWREEIKDEDQSPTIKGMFRACGWGFWVDDADGYRNNAKHAWCGIFQGYAASLIGYYLEPGQCVSVTLDADILKHCIPSTARMVSDAKWRAAGVRKPQTVTINGAGTTALVPGALATIAARDYGDRRNEYGGHFVLVESYDANTGMVATVEGNAWGTMPDGSRGEGVVRNSRPVEQFRRVFLFDVDHYEVI